MKANELIKKFKEMGFAVYEDESSIEIRKGFMSFTYGKYIDPSSDTAQLFTLLDKYYQTPVKDRFSEKKYRLRWSDDSDCSKNYIGLHRPTENFPKFDWYMTSAIEDKSNNFQELWTESELEQLKKTVPRLAPAIDAMKEPAEDKDE